MKYASLKKSQIKVKHIPVPQNGIDQSRPRTDIADDSLSFAKNIVYSQGKLTTRKGIFTKAESLLNISPANGGEAYEYKLTKTQINFNGKRLRIATSKVNYDQSHIFIFVYGIGDENPVNLGYIRFDRTDDSCFFVPQNIVFYCGKPQSGGGIFALVTLKNCENPEQTAYDIYEISADLKYWELKQDYYIPTVYINGKGNSYETASWRVMPDPIKPENRNILNGSFYAYYSSDGYSSNFRLPFTNIDAYPIICRIYYTVNEYTEWKIAADKTSATETFYGTEVTANADREKGLIYFTAQSGDYAIPYMTTYSENNIRIMASKAIENGFNSIVSSACATPYGDKILFSGGIQKNKLFYTDFNTPLYFPQVFDNEIGSPDEEITDIIRFSDRIIAFKPHSTYEIKIKNGGNFNTTALLADNGASFKKADSFTVSQIDAFIGSAFNTPEVCGEYLIWLGNDKKTYALSKQSNKAEEISFKFEMLIGSVLADGKLSSAASGKNYILSSATKALIINPKGDCYYFEFPKGFETVGILSNDDNIFILYRFNQTQNCYIGSLSGETDIIFYGKDNNSATLNLPIESEFTLKSFNFGSIGTGKNIHSIDLQLNHEGNCKITLGDGNIESNFQLAPDRYSGEGITKIITDIIGVKHAEISVCSNKGISFGGADIYYSM
ncbi:MAG: hypothetical protein U0K93_06140 [Acutalibacteraceae bacterium]|nr:hypothetical protein [Acutalibacteraceae bacterium]